MSTTCVHACRRCTLRRHSRLPAEADCEPARRAAALLRLRRAAGASSSLCAIACRCRPRSSTHFSWRATASESGSRCSSSWGRRRRPRRGAAAARGSRRRRLVGLRAPATGLFTALRVNRRTCSPRTRCARWAARAAVRTLAAACCATSPGGGGSSAGRKRRPRVAVRARASRWGAEAQPLPARRRWGRRWRGRRPRLRARGAGGCCARLAARSRSVSGTGSGGGRLRLRGCCESTTPSQRRASAGRAAKREAETAEDLAAW